jgi:hypothetical protein
LSVIEAVDRVEKLDRVFVSWPFGERALRVGTSQLGLLSLESPNLFAVH